MCLLGFFLFSFISTIYASVSMPSIFTDNMILQRQSRVPVWGFAETGQEISVIPSWNGKNYNVTADSEGNWRIQISTPKAGGPYEITIKGKDTVILRNVMVGEVWLCSGQSNMQMPMKGLRNQPVLGSNKDILKSNNGNIRLITVPHKGTINPQNDFEGNWLKASPSAVADFSASAYYFGRLVNEILDIPVGLIDVSYGGSCIQAWMSKNTAIPFKERDIPKQGDKISRPRHTPTALFNGMLSPLIGYGIRGCIWYQGESNRFEPFKYNKLMEKMVNEWRNLWKQGNFPFYYAQIAPFGYGNRNSAYLREAQLKAMDDIPNSGMAVLLDVGEKNCIHPANKKVVGNRLAYWALGNTYGIDGFAYKSPVFEKMRVKGSTAILHFKNAPNGLTSFGKELTNFEIAGKNKRFYPAKAYIRGDKVYVSSPKVITPVAVRYAFKNFVEGDRFSTEGLPVSSFRTDDW